MKTWEEAIQDERARVKDYEPAITCLFTQHMLKAPFVPEDISYVSELIFMDATDKAKEIMYTPTRVYFVCLDGGAGYDAYGIGSLPRSPA